MAKGCVMWMAWMPRASRYRCTAAITLEPLSNDIAINGSFS